MKLLHSRPRITQALAAFGSSGVPLYVFQPCDRKADPVVLPPILTLEIVRGGLMKSVC